MKVKILSQKTFRSKKCKPKIQIIQKVMIRKIPHILYIEHKKEEEMNRYGHKSRNKWVRAPKKETDKN